jgi:hypothetical protein
VTRFSSAAASSSASVQASAEELSDHVEHSADDLADYFAEETHSATTVASEDRTARCSCPAICLEPECAVERDRDPVVWGFS